MEIKLSLFEYEKEEEILNSAFIFLARHVYL